MITAHIQPILDNQKNENPLFQTLEIHMQRLGFLIPFREQLNWSSQIDTIPLGEEKALKSLKRFAARRDGSLPFILKLTKNTTFKQLMFHPNTTGVYLPFLFDEPFTIKTQNQTMWMGSSIRLAEELKWLELSMNKTGSEDMYEFWQQFRHACDTAKTAFSPFRLSSEPEQTKIENTRDA